LAVPVRGGRKGLKMIKRLFPVLFLALSFSIAGCPCNEINNPVSPEYPCGTRAYQCQSGKCCWNDHVCGGDPGVLNCPPGLCCFQGGDWAPNPDGGSTEQWKP